MMSQKKKDLAKVRIQNMYQNPNHKFAVFKRSKSGLSAQFLVVHDSQEKATEVARIHATEEIAKGKFESLYFVVEIKHKIGFEQGKPVDTAV